MYESEDVWKRKYIDEFGDPWYWQSVLDHANIETFLETPESWRVAYFDQQSNTFDDLSKVMNELNLQQSESVSFLCSKLLKLIRDFPFEADPYFFLAEFCYENGKLEQSLLFLEAARECSPSDAKIQGMIQKIEELQIAILGDSDEIVLLDEDNNLSSDVICALVSLFRRYDVDQDGLLSFEEMRNYVKDTNEADIPFEMFEKFCQKYSEKGDFDCDAFLSFYWDQTIQDPRETRKDLKNHNISKIV